MFKMQWTIANMNVCLPTWTFPNLDISQPGHFPTGTFSNRNTCQQGPTGTFACGDVCWQMFADVDVCRLPMGHFFCWQGRLPTGTFADGDVCLRGCLLTGMFANGDIYQWGHLPTWMFVYQPGHFPTWTFPNLDISKPVHFPTRTFSNRNVCQQLSTGMFAYRDVCRWGCLPTEMFAICLWIFFCRQGRLLTGMFANMDICLPTWTFPNLDISQPGHFPTGIFPNWDISQQECLPTGDNWDICLRGRLPTGAPRGQMTSRWSKQINT